MANTIIQIKRSTVTGAPANGSLAVSELAYSFNSDKLFIGNTTSGAIEIGGRTTVNTAIAAFQAANASFANGNTNFTVLQTVSGVANNGWLQANTARSHANVAFANANSTHTLTISAFAAANASFANGNTNFGTTVAAFAAANAASTQATTARNTANAAFANANTTHTLTISSFTAANAAFAAANTKFNSSGGTISGTTTITGDLIVTGNTVTTETSSMNIGDPLIYLAANNRTTDAVDIGWVGTYNTASVTLRTGFFRDATTKEYYVFDSYTADPAQSNHINPSANGFAVSVLNAAIRTSNLNLGGANAILTIAAAFNAANSSFANGNTNFGTTVAAFAAANASFANGNTNFGILQTAFGTANNGWLQANTARTHANSAFLKANNALANATGTFAGTLTVAGDLIATGNVNFDSGTLYVDAINNEVGIGTTSPTSNLHVVGTTNITNNLTVGNVSISGALIVSGQNIQTAISDATANASNASALSTGTVPSARISGSYTGITGLGTITVGTWNGSIITVPYGGTGVSTLTANSVLLGNGTGGILSTSGTDGQVLQSDQGVPKFANLDGGLF